MSIYNELHFHLEAKNAPNKLSFSSNTMHDLSLCNKKSLITSHEERNLVFEAQSDSEFKPPPPPPTHGLLVDRLVSK